jgi:hypothetical protein
MVTNDHFVGLGWGFHQHFPSRIAEVSAERSCWCLSRWPSCRDSAAGVRLDQMCWNLKRWRLAVVTKVFLSVGWCFFVSVDDINDIYILCSFPIWRLLFPRNKNMLTDMCIHLLLRGPWREKDPCFACIHSRAFCRRFDICWHWITSCSSLESTIVFPLWFFPYINPLSVILGEYPLARSTIRFPEYPHWIGWLYSPLLAKLGLSFLETSRLAPT